MPPEERGRRWLVEPIGPDEVRVHIDVGEGVRISDEAQAALDEFLQAIYSAEVEGFATFPTCPELRACGTFFCRPLGKCTDLSRSPCFADTVCKIALT
jgi:hypothetical protein